MKFIGGVLFFIIIEMSAGKQVSLIDVSGPATSPPVSTRSHISNIPALVFGAPAPASPLSISFAVDSSNDSQKSTSSLLRVQNQSSSPVYLPTSRNGDDIFTSCPDHRFLSSYVSITPIHGPASQTRIVGELYGCQAVDRSLVKLAPGDWVIFKGLVLPSQRGVIGAVIQEYSLSEEHYAGAGAELSSSLKQIMIVKIRPAS